VRPVRLARRTVEEPAAPEVATPPRGRTARLAATVLPPLLAFVAANALVWHAAGSAGYDFFDPRTWALWDGGQYLSQARRGLTLVPCKVPPYKPGQWCGNAGWFPLYPALVRGVSWTGLPLDWSGVVVAQSACLALLAVVWRMLGARLTAAAVLCLALAAVFPGMVYDHAVFPISLASLATLLCLHWLARGRWVPAGLATGVRVHHYRGDALLVPLVLLIRYLPRPVQAVLVAVCAVLAWHMVVLFCRATLV
jgi:hypothetical protein